MFLSIVIPHYNLPRDLLMRCLTSLSRQEIAPGEFEVIVVDDGSDTPPEWVTDQSPVAHTTLIKREHGGLGAARNTGLNATHGEYIMLLDSDDYLYPYSLEPCLRVIKSQRPDLLGFRFKSCSSETIDEVMQPPFTQSYTYSGGYYMLHNNLPGCAWLYLFRRELMQRHNVRFNEGILHEDEDFTTRIYYFAQTAIHCNRLVYAYYRRSNSIVTTKGREHQERRFADLIQVLHFLCDFQEEQKSTGNITQLAGLKHKITLLTVDFIINLVHSNTPYRHILKKLNLLSGMGLYPLPKASYGRLYTLFRFLANHKSCIYFLYPAVHLKKMGER